MFWWIHRVGYESRTRYLIFLSGSVEFEYNEDKRKIINIPSEAEVKIIKPWNGIRYKVRSSLLTQYYIWSQVEAVNDIENKLRRARLYDRRHKNCHHRWPEKIDWIERLRKCFTIYNRHSIIVIVGNINHISRWIY